MGPSSQHNCWNFLEINPCRPHQQDTKWPRFPNWTSDSSRRGQLRLFLCLNWTSVSSKPPTNPSLAVSCPPSFLGPWVVTEQYLPTGEGLCSLNYPVPAHTLINMPLQTPHIPMAKKRATSSQRHNGQHPSPWSLSDPFQSWQTP